MGRRETPARCDSIEPASQPAIATMSIMPIQKRRRVLISKGIRTATAPITSPSLNLGIVLSTVTVFVVAGPTCFGDGSVWVERRIVLLPPKLLFLVKVFAGIVLQECKCFDFKVGRRFVLRVQWPKGLQAIRESGGVCVLRNDLGFPIRNICAGSGMEWPVSSSCQYSFGFYRRRLLLEPRYDMFGVDGAVRHHHRVYAISELLWCNAGGRS